MPLQKLLTAAGRDMSKEHEQERELLLPQSAVQTRQYQDQDQLSRSCKVTALLSAPLVLMVVVGIYNRGLALQWMATFGESLRAAGPSGMLLYILVFCMYLLLCGPSTPFEMLGGVVYPLPSAIVLNMLSKGLGSVACFLLARRFRSWARRMIAPSPSTAAAASHLLEPQTHGSNSAHRHDSGITKHAGTSHHRLYLGPEPAERNSTTGAGSVDLLGEIENFIRANEVKALLLSRFLVAPFSLKNYGLGTLPSVSTRTFAWTSVVGDFPMTVAFSYTGASVGSLVALSRIGDEDAALPAVRCAFIYKSPSKHRSRMLSK